MKPRVIPCLLLKDRGLYKTRRFRDPQYIGDPINAVKILNDKEVDELVFLDVSKNRHETGPNFEVIEDIAGEAFMPLAYGGGISQLSQARRLFKIGIEKVILSSVLGRRVDLVCEVADLAGSSSTVVCLDVKRTLLGRYVVYFESGRISSGKTPIEFARELEDLGAGEIILNNIDREGTFEGYDLELIRSVSTAVRIPVVALGGAASPTDFAQALSVGASAVGAGSMFVYHGRHRAVLITYDSEIARQPIFSKK